MKKSWIGIVFFVIFFVAYSENTPSLLEQLNQDGKPDVKKDEVTDKDKDKKKAELINEDKENKAEDKDVKKEQYKVEGSSKNIAIDLTNQIFLANKGFSIEYEDIRVEAKSIKKIPNKNILIAEGEVIAVQANRYRIEADTVEVNLETKELKVKKGYTLQDKIHIRAEDLEAKYPDKVSGKNVIFTTCDLKKPHFHFKVQSIDLYPGEKAVAYKGWLYLGENFRLLPIPIYAKSLKSDASKRAPLMPQIYYDEPRGTVVVYGFDYMFMKNKKLGPIKSATIDSTMNAEWGTKRGFGIENALLKYKLDQHEGSISGKFVPAVNEEKKAEDKKKIEDGVYNVPDAGSLYSVEINHKIVTNNGWLGNFNNNWIFGRATIEGTYLRKSSNLNKDSEGKYIVHKQRDFIEKWNIGLNQDVWKYGKIEFRYKDIKTEKEQTLKDIFQREDERLEKESQEKRNQERTDTTFENFLKLTHNDNRTHLIEYSRKRNGDKRPEKGASGKSGHDDEDVFHLKLEKFVAEFNYEKVEKDSWNSYFLYSSSADSLANKDNNYLSGETKKEDYKLTFGKYYLFHKLNTKFDFSTTDNDAKTFSRDKELQNRDLYAYYSAAATIQEDEITLLKFRLWNVKYKPRYRFEYRKYKGDASTTKLEAANSEAVSNDETKNLYIHIIDNELPITLYDNLSLDFRTFDLKMVNTPKFKYSWVQGSVPKSQKAEDKIFDFADETTIDLGNMTKTYIFSMQKKYDFKDQNFLKNDEQRHSGNFKIAGKELLAYKWEISKKWDEKFVGSTHDDKLCNDSDVKSIALDFDVFGAAYTIKNEKSYSRILNAELGIKKDLSEIAISKNDKVAIKLLNFKFVWDRKNIVENRFSTAKSAKYSRNRLANDFKLSYEFKDNINYFDRKFETSYGTEWDEIEKKYLDTKIGFLIDLEFRGEVEKEKKELLKRERERINKSLFEEENAETSKKADAAENAADDKIIDENKTKNTSKDKTDVKIDDKSLELENLLNAEEDYFKEEDIKEKELKDDYLFEEEAKIDKILNKDEKKKSKYDILTLGEAREETKLDDKTKKFSFSLELTHDSDDLSKRTVDGFSLDKYAKSLKRIDFKSRVKISTYIDFEFNQSQYRNSVEKSFDNTNDDTVKNNRNTWLKFQLGKKDYEWWLGFKIDEDLRKKDTSTGRILKRVITVDKNMHCTRFGFEVGQAWDKIDKINGKFVYMVGFNFSINVFPENKLGFENYDGKFKQANSSIL